MSGVVRVGIVGVGGMGERHAHNLAAYIGGARLVAVTDPDDERAGSVATRTGATTFTDAYSLIGSDEVDAVVIASPDATHAELAAACLDHGKPALVEKPMALDLDAAERLVEKELQGGHRRLQIGFMRRYDPQHEALRREITSGTIGRPLLLRGWHRNVRPPMPGTSADLLLNSAIHDLYSARWLLGQEPSTVQVMGTTVDPRQTDALDLQVITLTMDGGAMAVLEIDRNAGYGYEVGVEIVGSVGTVTAAPHQAPVVRRHGAMLQRVEPDWLERFATAYVAEIQAWVTTLGNKHVGGPSAWDGYRTLAAALAAVDALEGGGRVAVDVPATPPMYVTPGRGQ